MSDLCCIPLTADLVFFEPMGDCSRLVLHLWSPKEAPGKLVRCSVDPVHGGHAHICTPCSVRDFSSPLRFNDLVGSRDWSPPVPSLSPANAPRASCPSLAVSCSPDPAGYFPLVGSQRISKIVASSLKSFGRFPLSTHGKDARSIAASHCFNVGIPEQRILRQGRWSRSQTFRSHYLRRSLFAEFHPSSFRSSSIAEVLRMHVSLRNR